jgi:hypothetical protein
METKIIEFTFEEINLLKNALYFIYYKKLDALAQNRKIMSLEEEKTLLNSANKYFDLTDKL